MQTESLNELLKIWQYNVEGCLQQLLLLPILTCEDIKMILIDKYLHHDGPFCMPQKTKLEPIMRHLNFQVGESNKERATNVLNQKHLFLHHNILNRILN